MTSVGAADSRVVTLRIPAWAPLGQGYDILATRSDDPQSLLSLDDVYEVCSFGASRDVVAPGGAVRLRGCTGGVSATLFMRHRAGSEPTTLKARGWTKVTTLAVSDSGRFISPVLHPARTTWYIVRFAGADGGFTAFTPVVRVRVR